MYCYEIIVVIADLLILLYTIDIDNSAESCRRACTFLYL